MNINTIFNYWRGKDAKSIFERVIVDRLIYVSCFEHILKDKGTVYYKSKSSADIHNQPSYYKLSIEEFDYLADNYILTVKSKSPGFVLGYETDSGRRKLKSLLNNILDYLVEAHWQWQNYSPPDNSITFAIENIIFTVKIFGEYNKKLVFARSSKEIHLENKPRVQSFMFNKLANLLCELYPDAIKRKLTDIITLDTRLLDSLIEEMLNNKMADWREYMDLDKA